MNKTVLNTTGPDRSRPAWMKDFRSRDHLVPGGAILDPAGFGAAGTLVPSGCVIGQTQAQRDAGSGWHKAADADDYVRILAFGVTDGEDVVLYRPGGTVAQNFLPDWGTLSSAVKAKLQATYIMTLGAE